MPNLVHRFVVVGDLHGRNDSGNNFTPVSGAYWPTESPPSPPLAADRMDMMKDRVTKEITDNQVDFVYFIGDIINNSGGSGGGLQGFLDFKADYLSDFG